MAKSAEAARRRRSWRVLSLGLAALAATTLGLSVSGTPGGVLPPPPPYPGDAGVCDPPPSCPKRVVVRDAARLKAELEDDLGGKSKIVEVPDGTDIALDRIVPIKIKAGHTLQSTRGALRSGALLHLDRFGPRIALQIEGDGVTIRSVRLRGPSRATYDGHDSVTGIYVKTQYSATIVDNEIFDWPGMGVRVNGPGEVKSCPDKPAPPSYRVRVARNYIHHNQLNPLGYGVRAEDGGVVLVEGNTFDWNRHAIDGDGSAGNGFRALYNYVLSGGSKYHGTVDYYNQHFDMHGASGGDGGIGGSLVEILGNVVHGEQRYGGLLGIARQTRPVYWLRGYPCVTHEFRGNVLVHEKDEALRIYWPARDRINSENNHYDTDTSWSVAVGDFDRDRRDDLFQASGTAWYYSSGGQAEWRLLQSGRYETIERLRFGDFDGDGATDVFRAIGGKWRISRAGTDRWHDINSSHVPLEKLRFADFDGDGRSDVFTATGSRWLYSPGGTGRWQELRGSGLGVEDVRFGSFDDDDFADVFALVGGKWAVSYDGLSSWRPLAPFSTPVDSLVLADFNGNGKTDVARTEIDGSTVRWLVSVDGRGGWRVWREFKRVSPSDDRARLDKHWLGRFDSSPGLDAIRYEPPTSPLVPQEGVYLVRSSGAREPYVRRSRNGMR